MSSVDIFPELPYMSSIDNDLSPPNPVLVFIISSIDTITFPTFGSSSGFIISGTAIPTELS